MTKRKTECLKQFRAECYEKENQEFQRNVLENLTRHAPGYKKAMQDLLKKLLKQLGKIQILSLQPAGSIEISFLRMSVFHKELLVKLEVYDERQNLGDCIFEMETAIGWLKEEWEELKENLNSERLLVPWAGFIKQEDINVLLQESLDELFTGLVFFFKYEFSGCSQWEEYQSIQRAETFCISMGEYHDWQKKLFVDREAFDIFLQDRNISLRYGTFQDVIYRRKKFQDMDLKGSCFVKCRFLECSLHDSVFTDCQFTDCEFRKCEGSKIDFSGSVFRDCSFIDCDFEDVIWSQSIELWTEPPEDLYRATKIQGGSFKGCRLDQEKWKGCILEQTRVEDRQEKI